MDLEGVKIVTTLYGGGSVERTLNTDDVFDEYGDPQKQFLSWTLSECIKAVRGGTTITIKPVMSLDDEYEVAWDNMSDTSQFAICGLIHAGKKIAAIKLVREETQWGLKEAKQMVDSAWIHTKLGEVV